MKSLFKILLLAVFSFSIISCKTKFETCTHSNYYVPFGVGFIGYDSSEVQTIILEKYTLNAHFTDLISSETLNISNFKKLSDTLLDADYNSFFDIKIGFDYKLVLVPINKTLTISNIEKGPDADTFIMNHCSPGAGQARFYPYTRVKVEDKDFVPTDNPYFANSSTSSKKVLYLHKF